MTYIEQAIREAVEKGGYRLFRQYIPSEGQPFIAAIDEDSIKYQIHVQNDPSTPLDNEYTGVAEIFLDSLFWQALGKAKKWNQDDIIITFESMREPEKYLHSQTYAAEWQFHWHAFIGHLAEGKDTESFFKDLLKINE